MRVDFFKTKNCRWPGGPIQLKKSVWHSCMQWGWPSLNAGEHPIEWYEYWVLSIRYKNYGVCWQFHPLKDSERNPSMKLFKRMCLYKLRISEEAFRYNTLSPMVSKETWVDTTALGRNLGRYKSWLAMLIPTGMARKRVSISDDWR